MENVRSAVIWRSVLYFIYGGAALSIITYLCFRFDVNSTTVALLYLIVIVLISLRARLVPAALIAGLSYIILDSFFTAPLFRLGLTQPLDFVAPIAYLTTAVVITRLMKNSRQSFREIGDLKDQLRLIVDTIPGLVWSAKADGAVDFLNRRWLEYTGLKPEEGLDWGGKVDIHPDDREKFLMDWKASLAGGKPLATEARVRRADGNYRRLLIRAVPVFDDRGKVVKWYGANTDIEDQKRAEEELRRSQTELARITQQLNMGEMAAAIAHEINQPLSAIVNNAGAGLRWLNAAEPNLDEARETAKRIIRDGNRASNVIVRIRALLRKTGATHEPLDLNRLIEEVVEFARAETSENKIKLRLELAENIPSVAGDRIQLQQAVLNLIRNGIEAMEAIPEQKRKLFIRSEIESENVIITIRDTGRGIGKEDLKNIFDAFFTTKSHGMGMGLAISRSVAESHGGELRVISEEVSGAAFQMILPKITEETS